MDEATYIAEKQGQMAIRMARIASLLTKDELTTGDLNEIQNGLSYMIHTAQGKDKGMSAEISAIARAVALRSVRMAGATLPSAPVTEFGNGAHAVLPKNLTGKTILYTVQE